MIILVILIVLLLLGVVAVDVSATIIGGAVGIVLLIIAHAVRKHRATQLAREALDARYNASPFMQPPEHAEDGRSYCDDCKYCYGQKYISHGEEREVFYCLKNHPNPQSGPFIDACEDFLSRR